VVNAINRADMDLRRGLYESIVLSGGSTLTRGFGDRLLHEIQRMAVKDMRIKIYAPPERKYTTWLGGSILAGLTTFKKVHIPCPRAINSNTNKSHQMWVEKNEWQENPDIIHSKCP